MRDKVTRLVENSTFQNFLLVIITLNAVTLGLETSQVVMGAAGPWVRGFDYLCLIIYCAEIALKLAAYRVRYFRSGWNVFDFFVVGIAFLPDQGSFAVLRALRIFRALRVVTVLPRLRRLVGALLEALPGMGAILLVLVLVFYVSSVLATNFFGQVFVEWFGTIGRSMYSLFQIMTLESWSMGIVRPVMKTYPWAWAFFVPFIVCVTFAVLNLFIAVLVNSIQHVHDAELKVEPQEDKTAQETQLEKIEKGMDSLHQEIRRLNSLLARSEIEGTLASRISIAQDSQNDEQDAGKLSTDF